MLRLAAACLFFFSAFGAHSQPAIDWRLKHPFRYFVETTDFDMHREAMAEVLSANGGSLTADAVSRLERLVNDPRWLREWYAQNPSLYPDPRFAGSTTIICCPRELGDFCRDLL